MAREQDFDRSVAVPPGLTVTAVRRSIDYIESEVSTFIDIYLEQRNVLSAIIGILGTKALDQNSIYEKVRHSGMAQTRFPDLCRRNSGPGRPSRLCLESKGSMRPWAIESHYDHEGWYIVWRYPVDVTCSIEPERPVIIWRVDIVYLRCPDWEYRGSTAGTAGGGRTHTFNVRHPATRLRGCAFYRRSDIQLAAGKPVLVNGDSRG